MNIVSRDEKIAGYEPNNPEVAQKVAETVMALPTEVVKTLADGLTETVKGIRGSTYKEWAYTIIEVARTGELPHWVAPEVNEGPVEDEVAKALKVLAAKGFTITAK